MTASHKPQVTRTVPPSTSSQYPGLYIQKYQTGTQSNETNLGWELAEKGPRPVPDAP
jgi:hypothetical protein